ncbi:type I-E CRISPR-associated protein Cse2/CasB [Pseudonocardia sp. H11422]|uniref:type I-E CRISPR-associated protein Cse2/CasB n=1 Tax=Pseudonocardia sp. H11422 TaxID=2835866 RepID=UPI001BDC5C1B|nr:type I-E CRISPR-associated protein Cse2/CasB [Pseudonocardia sp. H11422]
MTASSTEPRTRALGSVGTVVDQRVSDLQNRFLNPDYRDPAAVAALARLRRGAGKEPGELLDILEYTVSPAFFVDDRDTGPSIDERAAHVALTLFAVHQQSRGERMHRRGRGLGDALRSLHTGAPNDIPDPLLRRFRMLGTADSFTELTHHLRGAVQLLRAGGVALDYGRLADQLVAWQRFGPDHVQLTWGREFYRTLRTAPAADQPADDQPSA